MSEGSFLSSITRAFRYNGVGFLFGLNFLSLRYQVLNCLHLIIINLFFSKLKGKFGLEKKLKTIDNLVSNDLH